jgi:hypothetical protein
MNTNRRTWIHRLTSIAMSAFITVVMLGSIDALSQRDMAPDSLMAQAAQALAAARS